MVEFECEFVDVLCGGLCVKVIDNGVFIFVLFLIFYDEKIEMDFCFEELVIYIKGEKVY